MILFKPQRWENSYFKTSLKAARTRFFTSRKKWTQVVESVVYVGDEHSPLGDLMVLFRLGLSSSAAVLNPSLCAEASLAHWCPHKMGDWFLSCEDNVCCAITHHWQPDPVLLQHKHRKKKNLYTMPFACTQLPGLSQDSWYTLRAKSLLFEVNVWS